LKTKERKQRSYNKKESEIKKEIDREREIN